ncbi:MAG: KEOPS complex N(6)-L-threonylcarbamoyladenine synthase Kae1 [Candidatus Woesearchaeota archaeon]
MIVLGIESTAHTFGIGIIKAKRNQCYILSNQRSLYTTESGGMIPSKVSQFHIDNSAIILEKAMKEAKIRFKDIDLIAYSESPGIGHSLRIGAACARTLAIKLNKPIIGVNHCIAHLEIGRVMTKAKDPILLYLSGANTQVIAYEAGKYRIFGETLDIGIGNFLDSFARELKLGFPGGPKVSKLAEGKKTSSKLQKIIKPKYIELPYVVKGMDVSFGGILTNLKQKIKSEKFNKEYDAHDLCYSAQETVFSMMLEVAERAMAHCNKNELLLGGGVACNNRLKEMTTQICKDRKAKSYFLANELNVDNGIMIAWLGFVMYQARKKETTIKKAKIRPYIRTDEVKVTWRK